MQEQSIQPVISIMPKGDGVRIFAAGLTQDEKIRLLTAALAHLRGRNV